MDLSEALVALTRAVEENTAALRGAKPQQFNVAKEPAAKAEKPKAEPVAELTYEKDVKPVALKVAGKLGRDALVSLLADYQVTKATELPKEGYADFIKAANALLA